MTRQKPGDAVHNSADPPLTAPAELRYAVRQSSVSEALMFVTFRVGRANDADVVLEDTRVSRRQIEITVTAQRRYFVIDCGSTGGPFFGGRCAGFSYAHRAGQRRSVFEQLGSVLPR